MGMVVLLAALIGMSVGIREANRRELGAIADFLRRA